MGWHLIYRSIDDMHDLAVSVEQSLVGGRRVFVEETGAIVFLELQQR